MNALHAMRPIHAALPERVQDAVIAHRVVLVVSPITDLGLISRWLSERDQESCHLELNMRSVASREEFEQLRRATRWRSLPQIFIDGKFIGGTEQFFDAVGDAFGQGREVTTTAATEYNDWARWLGYAGLIPFFALALLVLFNVASMTDWATQAILAYGAIILSFVGALHWTRGLDTGHSSAAARHFTVSVMPALLGWIALLVPVHAGLIVLVAGFALLYAYDRQAWKLWPAFLSLRSQLTAGAVGSLLLVWLGSAAW